LNLDLTKPPEQAKLLHLIAEGSDVCLVWLAIPCGTFSRARERPLPRNLKQQGIPEPQPLRSELEPWGLKNLMGKDKSRVEAANELVRFCLKVIAICKKHSIEWVIENPMRSLLWFLKEVQQLQREGAADANYQACMYGGKRDKWQRLRSSMATITKLSVQCDKQHPHEPWGPRLQSGVFTGFHTDEEAEYPLRFCDAVATLLAPFLFARAGKQPVTEAVARLTSTVEAAATHSLPDAAKRATAHLRAAVGKQARGRVLEQLIPEHKCIIVLHCSPTVAEDLRQKSGQRLQHALGMADGLALPEWMRFSNMTKGV